MVVEAQPEIQFSKTGNNVSLRTLLLVGFFFILHSKEMVQGDWLFVRPMFFKKSKKKRFVVEYCDRSHFKYYLLDDVVLEFHWSREIIS